MLLNLKKKKIVDLNEMGSEQIFKGQLTEVQKAAIFWLGGWQEGESGGKETAKCLR